MDELVEATRKERVREAWIEQLLEDYLFLLVGFLIMYVLSCHTGRGRGSTGERVVKMILKAERKAVHRSCMV